MYKLFIFFLLITTPLWAADYTIVLTPERDAALIWAMKNRADRLNPTLPYIAPQDFLQNQANSVTDQFKLDMERINGIEINKKYTDLVGDEKQAACLALKLDNCEK